ncbi:MAG: hypothetical protein MZV70_04755 [Desulfobacterales bacterium]|nr:hypothetical protein [Desulfobacterales bacterium]
MLLTISSSILNAEITSTEKPSFRPWALQVGVVALSGLPEGVIMTDNNFCNSQFFPQKILHKLLGGYFGVIQVKSE